MMPTHDWRATPSLAVRNVEARVEELHRRLADARMDAVAIDVRSVDAGLGKFVFPLLVALVDEKIVIDSAWNHLKLGVCDVLRGELGVVLGRRLRIRGADRDIGRNRELLQSGCVHAEGLDDSWRHGKYGVDPFVTHVERRR